MKLSKKTQHKVIKCLNLYYEAHEALTYREDIKKLEKSRNKLKKLITNLNSFEESNKSMIEKVDSEHLSATLENISFDLYEVSKALKKTTNNLESTIRIWNDFWTKSKNKSSVHSILYKLGNKRPKDNLVSEMVYKLSELLGGYANLSAYIEANPEPFKIMNVYSNSEAIRKRISRYKQNVR